MGFVLDKLGRYPESMAAYTAALAFEPNDPVILNNRGYVHFKNGAFCEAIADLNASIAARDPTKKTELAMTHMNLANTLVAMQQFRIALEACDKSIKLDPKYSHAEYRIFPSLIRAKILKSMNRTAEALAAFEDALLVLKDKDAVHECMQSINELSSQNSNAANTNGNELIR